MAVIFTALALLALNGAYWILIGDYRQLTIDGIMSDPLQQRDCAIAAVSILLLIEGIRLLGVRRKARSLARQVEQMSTDIDDLASGTRTRDESIESLEQRLQQSERQVEQERARVAALETAKSDAEARARSAESKAATNQDESVRSEIVHFVSLLQEKGRFVDFIMDDIAPYSDAQVGAAGRVVHQGCSQVIKEYFKLAPVHQGQEGERITVEKEVDSSRYRLLGRVIGGPPFQGKLLHRGWRAEEVTLPRVVHDNGTTKEIRVLAPAEVEVG